MIRALLATTGLVILAALLTGCDGGGGTGSAEEQPRQVNEPTQAAPRPPGKTSSGETAGRPTPGGG
ncbi:MAG: hypothetical protein L0Y44_12370 [Phycisphaerales bacterium]|nr:hypothetical protein [Phycisphaerales bacterium]MCI0631436.1 hypothetical protein [Phycisphaerales bacterium]MCI0676591.1 hypothetical protein [Phycisphaerales bacterium]